jgi:hypothetical protein
MTDVPDEPDEHQPEDDDDAQVAEWPIKGPATPQQAILAIGFVFFLGVVVGFLLCRTF